MVYPLLYNGPVNYYARLHSEKEIVLECQDNYIKQTYRNRCIIIGPNGLMTLSIPVIKNHGKKTCYRDIRIDYDKPWNKIHWKSLVASYAASPYFEYIADELAPFYEGRMTFLVELNFELSRLWLDMLGLSIPISLSTSFEEICGKKDPREFIHPKKEIPEADPDFHPQSYHQVFSDRHGFMPNLSILDLLFNEGPDSLSILKRSLRT